MENGNGLKPALKTQTILERDWSGLPGYILLFPVTLALSGSMATEREATLGLSKDERAETLLDFRLSLLGDVLTAPPYVVNFNTAMEALQAKQQKAKEEYLNSLNLILSESNEKASVEQIREAERIEAETKLTAEEFAALYEPFPGWEEITKEEKTLKGKVIKFFGQKEGGRQVYQLLVEAVTIDYWQWATPRPTISVSAFMQSKPLISIIS